MQQEIIQFIRLEMYVIRKSTPKDVLAILEIYHQVAMQGGGIARTADEISADYVANFISKALEKGIGLVVENPADATELIAEIHCFRLEPAVFRHVLSDLTIVVAPSFQQKGIGKQLFHTLLETVLQQHPNILRVELIARESNEKALLFYEQIGFVREGRLERRIYSGNGHLEADIFMAWFNPNYSSTPLI